MFRTASDKICFLDIETVPCIETIRRAYQISEDISDNTALSDAYRRHGATPENPRPFLKPMFHRVVSVCVLFRKAEKGAVSLKFYTLPSASNRLSDSLGEADIVRRTLSFIGRNKAQVVGWNSVAFDQIALFQRAVILGVEVPAYCERPAKPWEGQDYFAKFSDANCDLMQILAGESGGRAKLGEFAAACGIPGKLSLDGGGVFEAYQQGKLAEISGYNECDVATTYLIWLRMAWVGGLLSEAAYEAEKRQFAELLQSRALDGATHWNEYLTAWIGKPAATATPIESVEGQVAAAKAQLLSLGVTEEQYATEFAAESGDLSAWLITANAWAEGLRRRADRAAA